MFVKLVDILEMITIDHGETEVPTPKYVYHLTMSTNIRSIETSGLRVGNGNVHYGYKEPKIFCITNLDDKDAVERISSLVVSTGLEAENTHDGDVVVFRVDTTKTGAKWYKDEMYDFKYHQNSLSVWTNTNILPSACQLIGKIRWLDLSVIPPSVN